MKVNIRGFTLIELLVVISIIGLLSSIMISSLTGAKDRARIGSSLQFASSVDNALGGAPLAWWDFSECAGLMLIDKSGNMYNGAFVNMDSSNWSRDIPYVNQTCSLVFNGVDERVDIGTSGKTYAGPFTVSVWVKPATLGGTLGIFGSRTGAGFSFDMKLRTLAGVQTITANIGNGTSWLTNNATSDFKYVAGSWYHIAYTINTTGYTIYLNGKNTASGTFGAPGTPLLFDATRNMRVGIADATEYFNGLITYFHVFNNALTQGEVERLYAQEKSIIDSFAFSE